MPAILNFAAAIKALSETLPLTKRCSDVREHIINTLKIQCRDVKINIPPVAAPHILSLTVPGIKAKQCSIIFLPVAMRVKRLRLFITWQLQSRALAAFGLSAADADTTIRLSFSGENTTAEADEFISALKDGIKRLCKI